MLMVFVNNKQVLNKQPLIFLMKVEYQVQRQLPNMTYTADRIEKSTFMEAFGETSTL